MLGKMSPEFGQKVLLLNILVFMPLPQSGGGHIVLPFVICTSVSPYVCLSQFIIVFTTPPTVLKVRFETCTTVRI